MPQLRLLMNPIELVFGRTDGTVLVTGLVALPVYT